MSTSWKGRGMGPQHDGTPGETDPVVLARRQRQIDFGKNTISYKNYTTFIPKESRCEGCPNTPNRYRKASRRGFDSMIRKWKIDVHEWSDAISVVENRRLIGLAMAMSNADSLSPPPVSSFQSPTINFCYTSPWNTSYQYKNTYTQNF